MGPLGLIGGSMPLIDDAREALAQARSKFPDDADLRQRAAAKALLRILDEQTNWSAVAGKGKSARDALDGIESQQVRPLAHALVSLLDKE